MMEETSQNRTGSLADGGLSESIALRDFLEGLGPLMRLPRKGVKSDPRIPEPDDHRRNRLVPLFSLVLIGAVVAAGAWFIMRTSGDVLPPDVLGSWKSDDPRYAGREFRLGPTMLTLQTGPDVADIVRYPIREVESRIIADTIEYLVTYKADGVEAEFAFNHLKETDEIIFEHQNELRWHRPEPPPAAR